MCVCERFHDKVRIVSCILMDKVGVFRSFWQLKYQPGV